jgi:hypothetical protein
MNKEDRIKYFAYFAKGVFERCKEYQLSNKVTVGILKQELIELEVIRE